MTDLPGRTALITGGSRGIGRATALSLAKAGARVIGKVSDRGTPARPGNAFTHAPAGYSHAEAATLPTEAVTAWPGIACRRGTARLAGVAGEALPQGSAELFAVLQDELVRRLASTTLFASPRPVP